MKAEKRGKALTRFTFLRLPIRLSQHSHQPEYDSRAALVCTNHVESSNAAANNLPQAGGECGYGWWGSMGAFLGGDYLLQESPCPPQSDFRAVYISPPT